MQTETSFTPEVISPADLDRLLAADGCRLIDVREPVEYAEEHISGARLIPLGSIAARAGEIGTDRPVVVMCRSGKRSADAACQLTALGFPAIQSLDGGILAWKTGGRKVETSGRRVLPLMRQVQVTIGIGVLTGCVLALTVHPLFVLVCGFFGAGLIFAGLSGWCGLALLLARMPWNKVNADGACAGGTCSR